MLGGRETNIKIGGDFDAIPMDKYTVQISDVDFVTQFNRWKGENRELLNYQFVVLDKKAMPEGEETTRGRLLWKRMSQVLSTKSWLMRLVKAVYGRDLTKEELEAFDPEAIIGKQVDVMVEQNPSKDGTVIYNNIVTFSKTLKKLESVSVSVGQTEAVKESTPAIKAVDTPELGDGTNFEDAFTENLEKENVEKTAVTETVAEKVEDDVAGLEKALEKAKAKAKKAIKAK